MLAGRIGDDDMATVNPCQVGEQRAERARINRRSAVESFWCCVEDDRDGGQFRAPAYRV
ncbi:MULTISPECIES: hypothetical protein [unclassified Sphingobium]|uniref:hypothetical protein n=1 Tax=unclassified Sphingobium TaxID=2611147 RepID=UPI000AE90924|nr:MULTISPECIES: hypothetical protein [unclassified Sphingobium]